MHPSSGDFGIGVALVGVNEEIPMAITRYRYYPRTYQVDNPNVRPQRATIWALVLVVVAAVIALTFSDAEGHNTETSTVLDQSEYAQIQ